MTESKNKKKRKKERKKVWLPMAEWFRTYCLDKPWTQSCIEREMHRHVTQIYLPPSSTNFIMRGWGKEGGIQRGGKKQVLREIWSHTHKYGKRQTDRQEKEVHMYRYQRIPKQKGKWKKVQKKWK